MMSKGGWVLSVSSQKWNRRRSFLEIPIHLYNRVLNDVNTPKYRLWVSSNMKSYININSQAIGYDLHLSSFLAQLSAPLELLFVFTNAHYELYDSFRNCCSNTENSHLDWNWAWEKTKFHLLINPSFFFFIFFYSRCCLQRKRTDIKTWWKKAYRNMDRMSEWHELNSILTIA